MESGVQRDVSVVAITRAAPDVTEASLRRWVAAIHKEEAPFLDVKASGRPKSLSDENLDILVGWILMETCGGEIVKLDGALAFLRDKLGVEIVKETLRLRLHDIGVETCPTAVHCKETPPLRVQVEAYIDWMKDFRANGCSRRLLCSLDFTYTSHRTSRPTTLAGKGRKKSVRSKISRFTNCLVTGLLSDGRQLSSILYTYNGEFRTDRAKTKRRRKLEGRLGALMEKYGISDERIVFDGAMKGEKRTFVREYSGMVRHFLEHHMDTIKDENILFLSDQGAAFKDGHESLIEKNGYGHHLFYPPCVHQFLSPNDNKLHGVAKAKWRGMFDNFDDDVECSLGLMHVLDGVQSDTIKKWFKCNMFLGRGRVTEEKVKELISRAPTKISSLHEACINEYMIWAGIESEESSSDRRLSSGLDGSFWEK
jgi:transposase